MVFASTPRTGHPQHRQQPVGDLHVPGVRPRRSPTFATRGHGFGIARCEWTATTISRCTPSRHGPLSGRATAARRSSSGHLPGRRSLTSDDPSAYRPQDELLCLAARRPDRATEEPPIRIGEWTDEQHQACVAEVEEFGSRPPRPSSSVRCAASTRRRNRCSTTCTPRCPSTFATSASERGSDDAYDDGGSDPRCSRDCDGARRPSRRVRSGRRLLRRRVPLYRACKRFGTHRCFDVPINESGIIGAAIGMGPTGCDRASRSSSPTTSTRRTIRIVSRQPGCDTGRRATSPPRSPSACRPVEGSSA